jgi:hypothetical protein
MNSIRRFVLSMAPIACGIALSATAASAQTTVRVTVDKSTIWKSDFKSVADVVATGTILTVVGQRKDWYEVVVARGEGGSETGFIFKDNVAAGVASPQSAAPARRADSATDSYRPPAVGFTGFGQFGYARFAAQRSFDAVMGTGGGGIFGGGAEVRVGPFFVGAAAEHFTKTGSRVFVLDQEVFRLGVPDTVTLTPLTLTAGWRFVHERTTPYVGGGIGRVSYREASDFADAGEAVEGHYSSYHLLGGVEFREGWVATAFEVQYSRVPNAMGLGGVSAAFQESDLGGLTMRVKVLVGR